MVHWRVVVERVDPVGTVQRTVIAHVDRDELLTEAEVGLSHDEGKLVLHALQSVVVADQIQDFVRATRPCADCGRIRGVKEHRRRHLDTLFGRIVLPAPRFECCRCGRANQPSPVSTLVPHRTTPELRQGALMPYRQAAGVLDTFLPTLSSFNHNTTRNRLLRKGQAIEAELQDNIEHKRTAADPVEAMAIGVDGAFVKAVPTKARRKDLEVIVGRIEVPGRRREFMAAVRDLDGQARERLQAALRRAGRGPATTLVVLSDGENEMRELAGRWLGTEQRHRLDWFHLRRRIDQLERVLHYLPRISPGHFHDQIRLYYRDLRRVRWQLWARPRATGPG
jgi:hypothetical protein